LCIAPLASCGDDGGGADADPFDTLQLCFDEHHGEEGLSVNNAIVVCCLDHPIAGVHPSCGDTAAACVAQLSGTATVHNPSSTSGPAAEVEAACNDYTTKKGQ